MKELNFARQVFSQNVLVFSRIDTSRLQEAVDHQLTLNLCNELDISTLTHFFNGKGVCPKVHLKVDTGMTRLGIDVDDAEKNNYPINSPILKFHAKEFIHIIPPPMKGIYLSPGNRN